MHTNNSLGASRCIPRPSRGRWDGHCWPVGTWAISRVESDKGVRLLQPGNIQVVVCHEGSVRDIPVQSVFVYSVLPDKYIYAHPLRVTRILGKRRQHPAGGCLSLFVKTLINFPRATRPSHPCFQSTRSTPKSSSYTISYKWGKPDSQIDTPAMSSRSLASRRSHTRLPCDRSITPRTGRFPSVFHDHHGPRGWRASVHFRDLQ